MKKDEPNLIDELIKTRAGDRAGKVMFVSIYVVLLLIFISILVFEVWMATQ